MKRAFSADFGIQNTWGVAAGLIGTRAFSAKDVNLLFPSGNQEPIFPEKKFRI
jgi:hypothetical protein